MAEPIKQEIINSIYENGEQLITGPVLQEVLLDMVNDYNAKDAALSSSVAEAIEAIPIVDPTVLATTESLNQLSESLSEAIPDVSGLATTESVNQLSESVAEAIADIPQPDLSGYATTQSVNEATESVKEWVEGKHYLTSASLSGSVTEETVGFMINDATASVKEWVESQSYATETLVSESIAGLDIPDTSGLATTESLNNLSESVAETIANLPQTDLSGYLTTESYNQDSASFDERINAITGSEPIDLSGYATTASLNSLSESVASDFANLDIPDVSTLATTESVLELSESLASMDEIINDHSSELESLENVKSALEDTGIVYWDEEEEAYVAPERVSQEDFTQFSESVANDVAELSESIANIPTGSTPQDLSGYLTTASYQIDSASFDQRIDAIVVPDLSTYATTASVNELSESLAAVDEIINDHSSELESLESAKSALEEAGIISWDEEEQTYIGNEKVSTEDFTNFSESVASDLESIQSEIPDVSIYATTQSLNNVSQSLSASIAAITGSTPDLSGYATTASLNSVSQSASETKNTVDQITNTSGWMNQSDPLGQKLQTLLNYQGGYSLVTWNGWSYELNLDRFATTQSLNSVSQSLSASIAASGGGGDDANLRNYLFGTGSTGGTISPASASNWVWTVSQSATFTLDGEIGEGKSIQVIVFNNSVSESVISFNSAYYGPNSVVNGVVGTGSFSIPAGTYGDIVATQIGNKVYFRTSVDLSKIEVDLSGYATTTSLNSVSESLSASIAAITSSGGGGGDYLPLTGGDLQNGEWQMETQVRVIAPPGDYESDASRVSLVAENPGMGDTHAYVALHETDGKEVIIRGEGTITFNIPESEEGEGDGAEMTFNFPEEGSEDDTLATRGWVSEEISTLSESVAADIVELSASIASVTGSGVTIVTTLTSGSTDLEVPSAKCVYDLIGDIESALIALR